MSAIKDMTRGNPTKLIISFALPLMLGNVFQQLYTIVDTMVLGNAVGVQALAAVGAGDWLNWLVLGLVTGFTQGFSILVAQRYGADDYDNMRKCVALTFVLSGAIAVLLTVISQLGVLPVLRLLDTPEDIIEGSLTYLRITYAGIIVITAYNMFAAILRALGDGRTPLVAMIIAAGINVVLDIIFVVFFRWGIAGAAIATVIAQLFSGLYCYIAIRRISILRLSREDFELQPELIKKLIALGTPLSLQNGIIGVGGIMVQNVVNGFGMVFIAGFTATNKLYGLLELAALSFGYSMATFCGQNLGAGQYRRINAGMRSALKIAAVTSTVIAAAMIVFGRHIVGLFISDSPELVEQAVEVAYNYLQVMCIPLFILYMLHLYRSALQGMGDTVFPMVSGVLEFIMRVVIVLLLPPLMGEYGIFIAEPGAWLGADLVLVTVYYLRIHHLFKLNPVDKPLPDSEPANV